MTAPLSRAEFERLIAPIEGWLGLREARALHEAARASLARADAPVAVEVGSWKGRSTAAIATAFARSGRGLLHAIDPHSATASHARAGQPDTLAALQHTLRSTGVEQYVRIVRAPSAAARGDFAPRSVHLMFVDGSHAYEDVLRDIVDWQPQLAPGATLALHDAATRPGVQRAAREHVLRRGSGYGAPRLVQNTLIVSWQPGGERATTRALRLAAVRLGMELQRIRARAGAARGRLGTKAATR